MHKASVEDKRKALLARRLGRRRGESGGTQAIVPVPRDGILPLSYQQEDFWFLHQLAPDHGVYNIAYAYRLSGELDVSRLEHAVTELIARHEPLRTRFAESSGVPRQIIEAASDPTVFQVVERPDMDSAARDAFAHGFAEETANALFDLSTGPLFRCSLVRFSDTDALLVIAAHHVVTDGWSFAILFEEIECLYRTGTSSGAQMVPAPEIQAVDHAAWQRDRFADDSMARQLSYWKHQLAGMTSLELPTDFPRPAEATWSGALVERRFGESLGRDLQRLARAENVSLLAVLLAGFLTVMARYTEEEDLAVGSVFNGRSRAELEPMVGLFVTTLILRANTGGDPEFRELVARCHESVTGALGNQDVPVGKIVDLLNPVRDSSRNPLYQIAFSLDTDKTAGPGLTLEGIVVEPVQLATKQSRLDMTVIVSLDGKGAMGVQIEYNTLLFEPSRIEGLAEQLHHVLAQAVRAPSTRIGELQLLPEAERVRAVHRWNDTDVDNGADVCLHDWIAERISRTPSDAIALRFGEAELDYGELDRRSNQLAHHLVELGVGPNVLVGVALERSFELVIGLLAVLKAGGAYLPLDPDLPSERLRFLLADSGVPVVLAQQHISGRLGDSSAHVVTLDGDWPGVAGRYPMSRVDPGTTPGDLAYVLYTSGSTGAPKGAMVEHRGIVNWLRAIHDVLDLRSEDVMIQKASLTFDSSVWEVFGSLTVGCTLVLPKPDGHHDRSYLTRLIADEGVSVLHFVPSMLRHFLEEPGVAELRSVRAVFCGGETLGADLRNELWSKLDVTLTNVYGPTETAPTATAWTCPAGDPDQTVPIGHMIANMRGYVLDRTGQPVPPGVPGELYLAGVGVGRGYLNRPDLTAERFVPDAFATRPGSRMYATGDMVRRRPDGALEFLGRRDGQVKVRGMRIETGEIEYALRRHPTVSAAAVAVRTIAGGEPQIVAYVVAVPSVDLEPRILREHLAGLLPHYMVPARFVTMEELPLTISGKLDYGKLLDPPTESRIVRFPPTTRTERILASLWASVLGWPMEDIDCADTFFELGGTSLNLMALIAGIRSRVGVELSVRDLYAAPALQDMSKLVENRTGLSDHDTAGASPLVAIKPSGSRVPFFCVHAVGGSVVPYFPIADLLHPDQPFFGLEDRSGLLSATASIPEIAAEYVRHVRTVQPAGPYLLGGWSMGGVVAFEMARILAEEGQEIRLVALLDSWVPPGHGELPGLAERLDAYLHDVAAMQGGAAEQCTLPTTSDEDLIGSAVEVMRGAGLAHGEFGDVLRDRIHVFLRNQEAFLTHRPESADLAVELFATEHAQDAGVAEQWRSVALRGVTEHAVPGDHYSMLSRTHLPYLVRSLQARLDAADTLSR